MTAQPTAGYSGTPLAKKLGIKPGAAVCAIDAPAGYRELIAPVPEGVKISGRFTAASDLVHLFSTRKADLERRLQAIRPKRPADCRSASARTSPSGERSSVAVCSTSSTSGPRACRRSRV